MAGKGVVLLGKIPERPKEHVYLKEVFCGMAAEGSDMFCEKSRSLIFCMVKKTKKCPFSA
jgi:hypothetical protein